MRRASLLAAGTLLVILAGCASQGKWVQTGKGAGDFETDHRACEAEATKDVYGTMAVNDVAYEECMTRRGWAKR